VPIEFKPRQYFNKNTVSDFLGFGTHSQVPGTFSDDASMNEGTMPYFARLFSVDFPNLTSPEIKGRYLGLIPSETVIVAV
jgi:hypothetical protein